MLLTGFLYQIFCDLLFFAKFLKFHSLNNISRLISHVYRNICAKKNYWNQRSSSICAIVFRLSKLCSVFFPDFPDYAKLVPDFPDSAQLFPDFPDSVQLCKYFPDSTRWCSYFPDKIFDLVAYLLDGGPTTTTTTRDPDKNIVEEIKLCQATNYCCQFFYHPHSLTWFCLIKPR